MYMHLSITYRYPQSAAFRMPERYVLPSSECNSFSHVLALRSAVPKTITYAYPSSVYYGPQDASSYDWVLRSAVPRIITYASLSITYHRL